MLNNRLKKNKILFFEKINKIDKLWCDYSRERKGIDKYHEIDKGVTSLDGTGVKKTRRCFSLTLGGLN